MADTTNTAGATSVGEPGRGTSQSHAGDAGGGVALGAALGKVIAAADGVVIFAPAGTNYQLQLAGPNYAGPVGPAVQGVVRVTARKVWTVPSGGNFIAPIFGTPKTIQGRVRAVEAKSMVVHSGCPIWVNLPDDDIVYDLANGPIRVGAIVNVTALPGATFEVAKG